MTQFVTRTLTRFLIEEQRRFNDATGNFTALLNDIRLACKRIATLIGKGRLAGALGSADSVNVSVDVSVDVRNTGAVSGDEVVQLYVRDVVSSVTRPVKELKAFRRITLAPGASTTVEFTLGKDAFAFWNAAMQYVVEPGEFQIMAGPNSVDLKTAVLTVVPTGE